MGTPLGPKYIPYTYMDPLGRIPGAGSELIRHMSIGVQGHLANAPGVISPFYIRAAI